MKTAPLLSESVTISSQVTPTLTLPIVQVLGYDLGHDAWQVGVALSCERRCESRMFDVMSYGGTHTCWVRRHEETWLLYDIKQPVAA